MDDPGAGRRERMAEQIQRARDSFSRCLEGPEFIDRFYDLFTSSSEEVAEKFRTTDFERQKKVLQDSLFVMLVASGTTRGYAHAELERLAKRHSRKELDIPPRMYALWLDCLMRAVEECDPAFSLEVESAWREALQGPIEFMGARYE